MDDAEIRKATTEDITAFFGAEQNYDIEAWIAYYKGQVAALAGFVDFEGKKIVFSDMKEGLDYPKTLAFKVCRELMDLMRKEGIPLITIALPVEEGLQEYSLKSLKFLTAMGFKYSHWEGNDYAVFVDGVNA